MNESDQTDPAAPEEFGTPEGRRIIALLWDPSTPPHGRGPKPKLSHRQVVDAGIAIADREGLEQVSMRKVAAGLGVGAMSLYTYVPGRTELVELMIDAAYAEHGLPDPTTGWRNRVEFLVRQTWALYRRHPWVLDYNQARLPLGPHVLDVEECLYAALADAGFAGSDNVAVANFIHWQLLGAGRSTIGDETEARRTGVTVDAYWDARSSFWATHFDPARYPAIFAIWQAGGFDDADNYSLDRLIARLLDAIDRTRPDDAISH
jgi:AcrR family transcriptional regulator